MAVLASYKTYDLGEWELQSGETIPKAFITYKTFGDSKPPAVLYPRGILGVGSAS